MTRWKSLAVTAGITAAVLAAAPAAGSTPPEDPVPAPVTSSRTITVSGTGTVRVDPDTADVNLGVEANAPTGEEAMEQVNAASAALVEALLDAGVAGEDIQTSNLSLWSTYGDDGREITGYHASLSVNVTIHGIDEDIAKVGATIDAAQRAAGEGFTIGGISFTFEDPEAVLEPARVEALANARRSAEQYAAAAGVTLGDVVSIVEHGSTPPIIYDGRDFAADEAAAAAGPTISPGQLDLEVRVTATFAFA